MKNELLKKFIRYLKLVNVYNFYTQELYHYYNDRLDKFNKVNTFHAITIHYFYKEYYQIEEIIKNEPYNKLFLNNYGINKSFKYYEILENEEYFLYVLFLRSCEMLFNVSRKRHMINCFPQYYKIIKKDYEK